MGQKHAPGYPLPSGELGEDEIVCQLVYLPDRPEYWQALLGALSYMATWRAWERDTDKRGRDAAANWREAFELSIGCWRMTCLEQLQDDVAAILAILEKPQQCCYETDVTDGDQFTDRVEDGVGDVPQNIIDAGYAEDAADWDGFDDYKCMISYVTVDQLSARLNELAPLVDGAGAVFGGLAALAAIIAVVFGTGGLALVFGLATSVGAVALLYDAMMSGSLLLTLAAKVVTNRDELACSIYQSDGDVSSLSNLNDKIDELFTVPEALVLKNLNLGPTLKSLYAGRYDQQDIAEILDAAGYDVESFNCECDEQVGEYLSYTDFESGTWEFWQNHGAELHELVGVGGGWGVRLTTDNQDDIYMSVHQLGRSGIPAELDPGDVVLIHRVKFWYRMNTDDGLARLICKHDGGQSTTNYPHESVYTEVERVFDPPLESTWNLNEIVVIEGYDDPWTEVRVDNVTIDFDVEYA